MSRATKVIFVRHGETEWNLQGRFQGQLDSPLTALGQAQAEAVALRLRQTHFDHLYSSDLGRTYETARSVAKLTNHMIMKDTRLREKRGGITQGMTSSEIRSQYPGLREKILKGGPDYAAPEAESLNQVIARGVEILDYYRQNYLGQTIVAITHGGFLSALIRHILCIPLENPRRFHIYNTSLNILSYRNDAWGVECMGDVSHLEQLATRDDIEGQ